MHPIRFIFVSLLALLIVTAAYGATPAPPVSIDATTDHSITLGSLNCGSTYEIRVRQLVNGKYSVATFKTVPTSSCVPPQPTAPGAPSLNSATASNGSVGLAWSAPTSNGGSAVTGYNIYRSTTSGLETLLVSPLGTGTSYTDSSVANGTTYFYKVSASNAVGEGALSNERSATPSAPTVPGAPILNSATAGDSTVALSWSAGSSGGSAITAYKIYRGTGSGLETILASPLGTGTTYNDNSAANGTTYYYKVSSVNVVGEGSLSNERSATPSAPPPGGQRFDTTLPAGTTGLPRALSFCMANIVRDAYNPNGNTAYNVPRDDLGTGWADARFSWWSSFPKWITRRAQIDDHYTYANGSQPTSTEIFSVGACRWGVREDLLRAVAVQESDWHEHGGSFNAWGDRCSGHTNGDEGFGSYGIMQVKNFNCANEGDWGGFPRTWYSAPFNVDLYGAAFRSCLEQSFWYTVPASDSDATKERGCVGAWFSGSYNPSISYTNSVYGHLANRDWTGY